MEVCSTKETTGLRSNLKLSNNLWHKFHSVLCSLSRMVSLSPKVAEKANGSLVFILLQECGKTFSGHLLLLQSIEAKMKSRWKNKLRSSFISPRALQFAEETGDKGSETSL